MKKNQAGEIIHCGPCFHRDQVYRMNLALGLVDETAETRGRRTRVITATDEEESSAADAAQRVRMTTQCMPDQTLSGEKYKPV